MERKRVVLLGATGSIGKNTMRVIRAHPDRLELTGIACRTRYRELADIAREFKVKNVALFDEDACKQARQSGLFDEDVRLGEGLAGLEELATLKEADIVLVAVVGTAGLKPALAAIEADKDIGLASKEILVLAGKFIMAAAAKKNVRILPVDSEHNAIFQCLQGTEARNVSRLILTASGGPFLNYSIEQMRSIQPADAMRHPNWSMGPKITIDSSTMANKSLEMVEAHWIFDIEPQKINVVVHPQSIVHSMVEFIDGSILAQMSPPSMTFAIQHILLYPERAAAVQEPLDFSRSLQLDFQPPDIERFPCLRLGTEALSAGGTAPAVFNAANEVAVSAFLENRIRYLNISEVIDKTLQSVSISEPQKLEEVLEADASARHAAREIVAGYES